MRSSQYSIQAREHIPWQQCRRMKASLLWLTLYLTLICHLGQGLYKLSNVLLQSSLWICHCWVLTLWWIQPGSSHWWYRRCCLGSHTWWRALCRCLWGWYLPHSRCWSGCRWQNHLSSCSLSQIGRSWAYRRICYLPSWWAYFKGNFTGCWVVSNMQSK